MSSLSLRSLSFFAGLLAIVACTRKPPSPEGPKSLSIEHGSADASALATPDAAVEDAALEAASPKASTNEPTDRAWTDPVHVKGLLADCAYSPPGVLRPKEVDPDHWDEGTALSCEAGLYGQSCAIDICYAKMKEECAPKCQKTCETCGQGCVGSCKSCKKACAANDASCLLACAESCASCRQECLFLKDRCASGTCGKFSVDCNVALRARWISSGCQKDCKRFTTCSEACTTDPTYDDPCRLACRKKHLKNCDVAFQDVCQFNGGLLAGESDGP
jgi:hypothetical protein